MKLIISAMKEELAPTLNVLQPIEIGKDSHVKLYQKGDWLFAISKIGLVNAAITLTTLIKDYPIEAIYNIGTVGTLKPTIELLTILLITDVYYTFADTQAFGYKMGQIPGEEANYHSDKKMLATIKGKVPKIQEASLGSSDIFIDKLEYFNHITTKFNNNIDVVDMEGGAFFQVALKYQIPIVSIKVVTDYLQPDQKSSTSSQFKENLAQAGNLIRNLICKELFNN